MPRRYVEAIYNILSDELVTSKDVAKKLGVTRKTDKDMLIHLISRGGIDIFGRRVRFWI